MLQGTPVMGASLTPAQKDVPVIIGSQVPPIHSQGFSGKWSSLPNQSSNQPTGQLPGHWGKTRAWDPTMGLVYIK